MTIAQMKYFSTVCETLSFTKASALLHVTQPAISAAIRDLEQECGVALFSRDRNTLRITDEGRVLLESIQPLLLQYDQLMHTVTDLHLERKYVRVGFATIASCTAFSEILTIFRTVHPDIVVEAVERSNKDLCQLLESDQLDVILSARRTDLDAQSALYHKRVVDRSFQVFCVNVDHPLAEASYVDWETIASVPLVISTNRFFSQTQHILRALEERGLKPNIIHYTDQVYTVERFIENNTACGFLPNQVAALNRFIVGIPYGDTTQPSPIMAYWKRSQFRPQAVELFLDVIRERAKRFQE